MKKTLFGLLVFLTLSASLIAKDKDPLSFFSSSEKKSKETTSRPTSKSKNTPVEEDYFDYVENQLAVETSSEVSANELTGKWICRTQNVSTTLKLMDNETFEFIKKTDSSVETWRGSYKKVIGLLVLYVDSSEHKSGLLGKSTINNDIFANWILSYSIKENDLMTVCSFDLPKSIDIPDYAQGIEFERILK